MCSRAINASPHIGFPAKSQDSLTPAAELSSWTWVGDRFSVSEMVEKVARTLHRHAEKTGAWWVPWDLTADNLQDRWREEARVAIEAMRESTQAMVDAGEETAYVERGYPSDWMGGGSDKVWQAMIDEALR